MRESKFTNAVRKFRQIIRLVAPTSRILKYTIYKVSKYYLSYLRIKEDSGNYFIEQKLEQFHRKV